MSFHRLARMRHLSRLVAALATLSVGCASETVREDGGVDATRLDGGAASDAHDAAIDTRDASASAEDAVVVADVGSDAGSDAGPPFVPAPVVWAPGPGVHHADPSTPLTNACLRTTYGGPGYDGFRDLQPLSGGGFVAAGTTTETTSSYVKGWLTRIAADGSVAWSWSIGSEHRARFDSVLVTHDGAVVATGWDQVRGPWFAVDSVAALLVRTSADGTMQWTRRFSPPTGSSTGVVVLEREDSTLLLVGNREGTANDGWMARVAADGTSIDERVYDWGGHDEICAAAPTSDGGLVVVGRSFADSAGMDDMIAMRLDAAGDEVWRRALGTTHTVLSAADRPCGVEVMHSGDVAIVVTDAAMPFAQQTRVVLLAADGTVARDRTYGAGDDYRGAAAIEASTGEIVVLGPDIRTATGLDFRATRLDATGDVRWDTRFGGSAWDYPWAIRHADAMGFFVGGDTESLPEVHTQGWILRLSDAGDFTCP